MHVTRATAASRAVHTGYECSVAAYATVDVPRESVAMLREDPGPAGSPTVPTRSLRYADEQTVVGLAAVLRAMASPALQRTDFRTWGVLAAPRLLGRLGGAATLTKFAQQGPTAVSPQFIPQNSLHAVSSAISVSLGMHGPNFGIGGGPEAADEGLLVAVTFLHGGHLPGLWLVLTEWDAEPVPDGAGASRTPVRCRGTALALTPREPGGAHLRLCASRARDATLGLTAWLTSGGTRRGGESWTRTLSWGSQVEFVLDEPTALRRAA